MDQDLENSTAMFGRLADPEGSNNALSQVLFGLALRSVLCFEILHFPQSYRYSD
jgi:hypothetical protein